MTDKYHILFDDQKISVDDEGFLLFTDDWSAELGSHIADDIGVEMSDQHWEVVHFIRDQFESNCSVPELRKFLQHLKKLYGKDKATRRYVYDLFPYGYGQQACKIAGMRKPLKLMLDL